MKLCRPSEVGIEPIFRPFGACSTPTRNPRLALWAVFFRASRIGSLSATLSLSELMPFPVVPDLGFNMASAAGRPRFASAGRPFDFAQDKLRRPCTELLGVSAAAIFVSLDAQPLNHGLQRRALQPEANSCAIRPGKHTVGFAQHTKNVLALQLGKMIFVRVTRFYEFRRWPGENTPFAEDDHAFDHVLEFAETRQIPTASGAKQAINSK